MRLSSFLLNEEHEERYKAHLSLPSVLLSGCPQSLQFLLNAPRSYLPQDLEPTGSTGKLLLLQTFA